MIRNKYNNQKREGIFQNTKFDEKLLGQFVEELEEVVLMLWFSFVLGLNLISFLFGYDNEFETKENEI